MPSTELGAPEYPPPDTPSYPLLSRFDRTKLKHLVWLFVIFTVVFALIYAALTKYTCKDRVKPCNLPDTTWQASLDGLYFSIATETTVGYGDFAPLGWSRVFACIQALGGLCIAGLFVTQITTGPSGKTKLIVDRMSGPWIEFCSTSKGIRTSLIHIRLEKGLFRYDGINFDETDPPNYLGIFEGSSEPTSAVNGPEIWFDYSNLESDDSAFSSGRTSLRFTRLLVSKNAPNSGGPIAEVRKSSAGKYTFFRGYAEDKNKGVVPMFAFRLSDRGEAKLAKSLSYSNKIKLKRSALVKAWLPVCEHYGDHFAEVLSEREERIRASKC